MRGTSENGRFGWRPEIIGVALIVLLYVTAAVPLAYDYLLYYPDERHYTDGAIVMARSHDWITPRTAAGEARLRKPILTYWSVAAGHYLFGVSPLGARALFVLYGAGAIVVTFLLARSFRSERDRSGKTALLAALIFASHPIVILSAIRSTPDMPLCLWMTIMLLGIERRLREQLIPNDQSLWWLYTGAGLAVATKGLPPLMLLGAAWCFCLVWYGARGTVVRLVNGPAMIVGGLVGVSWFASVAAQYGLAGIDVFWSDQVGNRFTWEVNHAARHGAEAVVVLGLSFLPWSYPLWASWRQRRLQSGDGAARRPVRLFCAIWVGTYLAACALVQDFSHRYLLPLVPLLAVGMADVAISMPSEALVGWLRRIVWCCCVSLFLAVIVAVVLLVPISGGVVRLAGIAAVASAGLFAIQSSLRGGASPYRLMIGNAAAVFALPPIMLVVAHRLAPVDQGAQIAASIATLPGTAKCDLVLWSKPAMASKVRVAAKGELLLRHVDLPQVPDLQPNELLIAQTTKIADWAADHVLLPVSYGLDHVTAPGVMCAIIDRRIDDYLEECRYSYSLAVPRPVWITWQRQKTRSRVGHPAVVEDRLQARPDGNRPTSPIRRPAPPDRLAGDPSRGDGDRWYGVRSHHVRPTD